MDGADLDLLARFDDLVLVQPVALAENFPPRPSSNMIVFVSVLRRISGRSCSSDPRSTGPETTSRTADDLAIWMRALVGGKLFDADYQRQWLDSLEPQDPSKPLGRKYGYGISQIIFGPNSVYFHGGEMPGYNSFMGYDPANDVALII